MKMPYFDSYIRAGTFLPYKACRHIFNLWRPVEISITNKQKIIINIYIINKRSATTNIDSID